MLGYDNPLYFLKLQRTFIVGVRFRGGELPVACSHSDVEQKTLKCMKRVTLGKLFLDFHVPHKKIGKVFVATSGLTDISAM